MFKQRTVRPETALIFRIGEVTGRVFHSYPDRHHEVALIKSSNQKPAHGSTPRRTIDPDDRSSGSLCEQRHYQSCLISPFPFDVAANATQYGGSKLFQTILSNTCECRGSFPLGD